MTDAMATETAAELLDQLIAQGLAPSNQDLGKIRQLIVILFQACVLQPITDREPFTPTTLQRARDTLRVLSQHGSTHPDLLILVAEDVPLYQFLLPRMVHPGTELSEDLISASVEIIRRLPLTAARIGVWTLAEAAEGTCYVDPLTPAALLAKPVSIYGCDLKRSADAALFLARIAISPRILFIDDTRRIVLRLLPRAAHSGNRQSLIQALKSQCQESPLELEPLLVLALGWRIDSELLQQLPTDLALVARHTLSTMTLDPNDPHDLAYVRFQAPPTKNLKRKKDDM
jgi:hypothetical protein